VSDVLLVADLNAIETRTGAWLAGCDTLLNVFKPRPGKPNGNCPYLDFACKAYGLNYDILEAQYKSKEKTPEALNAKREAKKKRQFAKPPVLGAIYEMGGGGWGKGKASYIDPATGEKIFDKIRTGLWGYAWGMGVKMEQEEAHSLVRIFRDTYREIPEFWKILENAVLDVMNPKATCTVRRVGPNGCIVIDKLNIEGLGSTMRIQLPSGRRLHYFDAQIKNTKMPWMDRDGNDVYRPALHYAHQNQTTGRWEHTTTHGGKIFENCTQGTARDVLACKLLEFEANDMPVVLHVHDEAGCLVPDDPFSPDVNRMVEIMSQPVGWAPGLLLGADGFEGQFYHK
jgi:hypothetical protein